MLDSNSHADKARLERLTKARVQLALAEPFLAAALMRLPFVALSNAKTMGTDGFSIFYEAAFVDHLTNAELKAIIAHELLHVLLSHPTRNGDRDKDLFNIACDLVVNSTLREMGFEAFDFMEGLEDLCLGRTAEEIYEQLKADKRLSKIIKGRRKRYLLSLGKAIDVNCPGRMPEDPEGDILEPKGEPRPFDEPDEEGKAQVLAEIRLQMKEELKKSGQSFGVLQYELKITEKPRIDWRGVLSQWMMDRLKVDWSLFPPNKKHLWQGLVLPSVGIPAPCHLIFAIDTSGSVDDAFIAKILSEIRSFRESFPTRFTILEADDEIRSVNTYEPFEDFKAPALIGRGMTDFRPTFQWIENHLAGETLALVYATDGYGTFPPKTPVPVLWIAPKEEHADDFPRWGQLIEL